MATRSFSFAAADAEQQWVRQLFIIYFFRLSFSNCQTYMNEANEYCEPHIAHYALLGAAYWDQSYVA